MAETLVENKVCEACGADVRAGSVFCYNCGGAVSDESPAPSPEKNNDQISDAWLQGDLTENNVLKTTRLEKVGIVEDKPFAKPQHDISAEISPEKIEAEPLEKTLVKEETKLKSAANMRRKAKTFQKKTVEVVWEEPESAPNKWFPVFAVVLILIVVVIYYLAMYLK